MCLGKKNCLLIWRSVLFYTNKLVFLGFVVSAQGIQVDEEKVRAIQEWSSPTSVGNVCSFHGLDSFYRWFVKDFSSIATPLIEVIKKNGWFRWVEEQDRLFSNCESIFSLVLWKTIRTYQNFLWLLLMTYQLILP